MEVATNKVLERPEADIDEKSKIREKSGTSTKEGFVSRLTCPCVVTWAIQIDLISTYILLTLGGLFSKLVPYFDRFLCHKVANVLSFNIIKRYLLFLASPALSLLSPFS